MPVRSVRQSPRPFADAIAGGRLARSRVGPLSFCSDWVVPTACQTDADHLSSSACIQLEMLKIFRNTRKKTSIQLNSRRNNSPVHSNPTYTIFLPFLERRRILVDRVGMRRYSVLLANDSL